MGRTYRNRKSSLKKTNNSIIEKSAEIISLNKWIKLHGFQKCKKIRLADFAESGRGVMASEKIHPGDVLMEIPFNLILNMNTLENDIIFKLLFMNLPNYILQPQSCQAFLSFYISFLKMSSISSFWTYYIDTIPTYFTVPYFCTDKQLKCFNRDIQNIVETQRLAVHTTYSYFKKILVSNRDVFSDTEFSNMISLFTVDLYTWAYFAVNTRCVYLDPEIMNNLPFTNNNPLCFKGFLNDLPNLGLIPFLDMFNHSSKAETDAKLIYSLNFHSKTITNIVTEKGSLIFRLASLSSYSKFDEIFISYGQHGNLKLLTEYGFCLPLNPFSIVNFSFDSVCNFFNKNKSSSCTISKDKFKYIAKHGINTDLYIDNSGLSYNFQRLLFLIADDDNSKWDVKIYSAEFDNKDSSNIFELAKPILSQRRNVYQETLLLCSENKDEIMIQCFSLFRDYVKIIDNFLVSYD